VEIANGIEAVEDGRILYRPGQRRVPRSWRHAGPVRGRACAGLAVAAREQDLCEVHACRRAAPLTADKGWTILSIFLRKPSPYEQYLDA
jgi:hypothetical protein